MSREDRSFDWFVRCCIVKVAIGNSVGVRGPSERFGRRRKATSFVVPAARPFAAHGPSRYIITKRSQLIHHIPSTSYLFSLAQPSCLETAPDVTTC